MIQPLVDDICFYSPQGTLDIMGHIFVNFGKSKTKPLVMVLSPEHREAKRLQMAGKLSAARIPVYPSPERAARALANMISYFRLR